MSDDDLFEQKKKPSPPPPPPPSPHPFLPPPEPKLKEPVRGVTKEEQKRIRESEKQKAPSTPDYKGKKP